MGAKRADGIEAGGRGSMGRKSVLMVMMELSLDVVVELRNCHVSNGDGGDGSDPGTSRN